MIIDTTLVKVERLTRYTKYSLELINTLRIVENATKQIKQFSESIDSWDEGCSCHISPPCSYCTSHAYCEICDEHVYNDYLVEVDGCLACEDCRAISTSTQ